jgi:tetratricopeptide (TPR) repeat protein
MALRLTDSSLPTRQIATAPGATARDLEREATRLLARSDLPGYRALFERAAAVEDPHERYRCQRGLLEQGLAAASRASATTVPQLYAAVAEAGLDVLETDPREPVLVNYVGVALYEIGAWGAAEQLFKATRRLAPETPHVDMNLEQVRRRRKAGQAPPRVPAQVAVARKALNGRGERAATRAVPATGLTLSLCMIVKDEQEMLGACLAAAAPAVDEIVVVDTGSSDATVEIARAHGARVLEHSWDGSFADARNVSLDAATGDWLIYLDADEVLVEADTERLRALRGHTWREAFYLVETNHTGDLEDGTAVTHNALRMFRNRPEYRFQGRLHEQVAHAMPGDLAERFEHTGVRVEHYGYLGVVRDAKEKSRRNIELLERQAAEGVATPFHAFNLGSEYAAAGDAPAALAQFQRAWDGLRGEDDLDQRGYVPSLISRLTKALRVNGQLEAAEAQADEGLAIFPGFTDLVFEQAACARDRGDKVAARELFERCLEMGDAPSNYSATVGCGSYLVLVQLAELSEPDAAADLLSDCLERHPAYLGSVLPLATALLRRGDAPVDVVDRVERLVASVTPSVSFMLGTAIYESGRAEAAEPHFRSVLERQPASGPALIALCECLLSQRRYDDAAELARSLEAGAPLAPEAARTEAFALLAGGRPADAAEALARDGGRGLPAAEAAVLGAWADLARGGTPPAALAGNAAASADSQRDGSARVRLPHESAPLLASMLEALLRVEEVDAFVTLLPLLDAVGLPPRERSELLAAMYLRRGFIDSAADEWIAVCEQQGPDPAALAGLAQVALARGLEEDARTFAEEALALDPDHQVAQAAARVTARA